ncbi:MAG: hypothetical protein IJ568_00730 [Bacilli bacterium]|nr:hypothetical protein [Bacilli bacterium]
MKNKKLIIYVGLVILVLGVLLFVLQKPKNEKVYINDNNTLSKEEANSIISEVVRTVINVYEDPGKVFEVEELPEIVADTINGEVLSQEDLAKNIKSYTYLKINNYEEKINDIFTLNGQNELENTLFGEEKFFINDQDDGYLFYRNIPESNKYINSTISVDNIEVKDDEINAEVRLTTYSLDTEDDDILSFYVVKKNIKLIKENEVWLVDTFLYNN